MDLYEHMGHIMNQTIEPNMVNVVNIGCLVSITKRSQVLNRIEKKILRGGTDFPCKCAILRRSYRLPTFQSLKK